MIVEISVVPIGVGESLSEFIAEVVKVIKESGVKHELTAMGTILEVENFSELSELLEKINERLFNAGSPRNYYVVKIDARKRGGKMEDKVRSVIEKL